MLEFIVLGQIPGTSFQINFSELIAGISLILAIVIICIELARIRKHYLNKQTAQTTDQVTA